MANLNVMILDYGLNKRKVNYIKKDGKIYAITSGQSNKVKQMLVNNEVKLLVDNNELQAKATIIEDKDTVKAIFEDFNTVGNNHFEQFNDVFVAIEFTI